MPKRKKVDVTVVKSKLELLFEVNDTRLLSDVCAKWAADKGYPDAKYKLENWEQFPCFSADNETNSNGEIPRYTFDLYLEPSSFCKSSLNIVLRKTAGHYLIVSHNGQRIYELDASEQFILKEDELMECYENHKDLFDTIFASVEIYAEKPFPVDTAISLDLSSNEIETLIKYASNQYPSAKDNLGTTFPTIHVVERCNRYTADANYSGDGSQFSYKNNSECSYDTLEELINEDLKDKLMEHFAKELYVSVDEFSSLYDDCETLTINEFRDKHGEKGDYIETLESLACLRELLTCSYVETLNELLNYHELQDYRVSEWFYQEIYQPVAFFLIREEAERYMEYQAHNLGDKPRVYTYSVGYNNRGDLPIICEVLLRLGRQLKGDK